MQVEHPITECITGVDIVKEMINAAAGVHVCMHVCVCVCVCVCMCVCMCVCVYVCVRGL